MEKERIAQWFVRFAEKECKNSCRLYEVLSYQIAEDDELLHLAANSREGQPIPNLFFGAVHLLLYKNRRDKLKEFYGSMIDSPKDPKDAFPFFKEFTLNHYKEIKGLLETKLVQTNEVRRCAYLYPIFTQVYHQVKRPLALVEIGTSAGLQLFFDQYSYTYGDGEFYGKEKSKIVISSKVTGNELAFPENTARISHRIGIDLHVNNLADEDDRLWLKALIWPSHQSRCKLFQEAAKVVQKNNPQLIEGNGVDRLRDIAQELPEDSLMCVFHTHVANQFLKKEKDQLLSIVDEIGKNRDIIHVYNNVHDTKLHVDSIFGNQKRTNLIGETDGHGRWFEWKTPELI